MKHYDVIVIGGGPSGLMAAIASAEHGASVLLIDKGNKLGRKLAISGGGRCNVTNRLPVEEIIKHIPGNGRFLYSAFSEFNNEDIISFFENLGIELKEEDHGRMFPVSNKAQSVVDALLDRLRALNVTIRTNEKIKTVLYQDGQAAGIVTNNDEKFQAMPLSLLLAGKVCRIQALLAMAMHGQKPLVIPLQSSSQQKYPSRQTSVLLRTKCYKVFH